jgi:glyoxylase-like metal-dependent hydrolase (beta-lactamase superfamily II)
MLPLLAFALQAGVLPAHWTTGGPDCAQVPDWQVHAYNDDLLILRQSGCVHYEKPFLYLLFGRERALLLDTGAGRPGTAAIVEKLRRGLPLLVVHSHAHGDHVAGDAELRALSGVTVMAPGFAESVDLGGRTVEALAIPGHDSASVAFYDQPTGLLLTGDSLYPGRLYIQDFTRYLASMQNLLAFAARRPVRHILGTHIEQSSTPFVDYPVRTTYQPAEHRLELSVDHLKELVRELTHMAAKPERKALRSFTIYPRPPRNFSNGSTGTQ